MSKKTLSLNLNLRTVGTSAAGNRKARTGATKEVVVEPQNRRRPPAAVKPARPSRQPKVETVAAKQSSAEVARKEKKRQVLEAHHIAQEAERKKRELAELRRVEELRRIQEEEARQAALERSKAEQEPEPAATTEPTPEETAPAPEPVAEATETAAKPTTTRSQPARPSAKRRPEGRRARDKESTEQKPAGRSSHESRRERNRLHVTTILNEEDIRQRSHGAFLRSQERRKRKARVTETVREKIVREVRLPETIVVQELANRMAERVADVVKKLMQNGVMVTQNQTIDADTAELIIGEFGHNTLRVSDADVEDVIESAADKPENLKPRPPVISVMGHVDHGKTSLLDAIRKTNVASSEAGGITQHIGAYRVRMEAGRTLTFLDTPGHAAFTAMRARGAQVTDIVVLVVAADDAVMPQTVEAINHAKAADVPVIVAINKCDLVGADPERVRNDLLRHEIVVEARSGDVLDVEVSAVTGEGIDTLLEAISLQAEILELQANPDRPAEGAVIESRLDIGRGPVATILVGKGTLRNGDVFVVGEQWGKVRALVDDSGRRVKSAGLSDPVEVLGLNGTPLAGDILNVVETEAQAREISQYRQSLSKEKRNAAGGLMSLEQLMKLRDGAERSHVNDLQVVVKADVQGSAEAIGQAIEKIGNDEVRVRILHSGVGAISETDVSLAEASNALIIGFNVRANASAREAANQKGIDIRYYSIIYALVDDVRALASNLLAAEIRDHFIGNAEILEIFRITGAGPVAGCRVTEGSVRKSASVRLLRDSIVIHEGHLKTLKRFKNDVNEVQAGQECGMAFESYGDMRQGDVIEIFEREEIQRRL